MMLTGDSNISENVDTFILYNAAVYLCGFEECDLSKFNEIFHINGGVRVFLGFDYKK